MRIIIYPVGSAGDVFPFLAVGKALKARGHEVFVAVNGYFEGRVREAGLEFLPMGDAEQFRRAAKDSDLWHPTRAFPAVVRHAIDPTYDMMLETAERLHRHGETVLVASTLGFGARNARDKLGIPLVTAHLAPAVMLSAHRMPRLPGSVVPQWAPRWLKRLQWRIGGKLTDRVVLPSLNAFRRRHGLPPVRDIVRDWWHSPDRVIGLWPDWFGPPQPDWPEQVRLTGFGMYDGDEGLSDELKVFLDEGESPVVFTPGSAMAHGDRFFAEAVRALQLLGRRGILVTPFRETIPDDLPDGVRHEPFVPFSKLLPRAALVSHHGGIGTCAQGLRASVPQLIMRMAHDQLDNLSRLRELGVAEGGSPGKFRADWIAAKIQGLLNNPKVTEGLHAAAQKFNDERWLRQTCELIEAANK